MFTAFMYWDWSDDGNLIDSWCTDLLQGSILFSQLFNKLFSCYGPRRFMAVFLRTRHCSLSWARWIQSTPIVFFWDQFYHYHPTHCWSLFFRLPVQNAVCISVFSHACYMRYLIFLYEIIPTIIVEEYDLWSFSLWISLQSPLFLMVI
jgi:hypothetical protein